MTLGTTVAEDGEWAVLEVADRGPGLPPGAGDRVFDRFYKADAARTRGTADAAGQGSGLGTAIALENARLHGGTIDAADGPGGGAVFTLRLPLRRADDERRTGEEAE